MLDYFGTFVDLILGVFVDYIFLLSLFCIPKHCMVPFLQT